MKPLPQVERRPRRNFSYQLDQERDRKLISFLTHVKQETKLITFYRSLLEKYLQEANRGLELTVEISPNVKTTAPVQYVFQLDKERDQALIDFLDSVRKTMDLSTFMRLILTDYMHRTNGAMQFTISLK